MIASGWTCCLDIKTFILLRTANVPAATDALTIYPCPVTHVVFSASMKIALKAHSIDKTRLSPLISSKFEDLLDTDVLSNQL